MLLEPQGIQHYLKKEAASSSCLHGDIKGQMLFTLFLLGCALCLESLSLFCFQALADNSASVYCVPVAPTGLPQGALLSTTTCPASVSTRDKNTGF